MTDQQPSAIVLWHVTMSLDGFIAATDGDFGWMDVAAERDEAAEEVIRTTGAFLAGRRSLGTGEPPYGGAWTGPTFVLTHDPPEAARYPAITFLSGSARDAVRTALAAANGGNLVVSGADVVRQCLEEELVDEIQIHLVPVLLGDGVRLFDRAGTGWIRLERTGLAASGQVTDLRFRVMKPTPVAPPST